MVLQSNYPTAQEAGLMGELTSRIPDLLAEKGWDTNRFVGLCIVAGLSEHTARRLAEGDTKVNAQTLAKAAQVLDVGFGDLMKMNASEQ